MKKILSRAACAVLICSLVLPVFPAYAEEEFVPGPGQRYDNATYARLRDDILEYDEIEMLIDEYNQTLKNLWKSYQDNKNSSKDVVKLKEQIFSSSGDLSEQAGDLMSMADMFKDALGYQSQVTPATYAEMLYSSELLSQRAEQMTLTADQLSEVTPQMLKIQVVDSNRAALIAGAQSAMVGYQQILLQQENLTSSIDLLEAVYESTQNQQAAGLATQNDVLSAKQSLESAQAGMLAMEAAKKELRQTLCTMLGWEYNELPEIRDVPRADLARIDGMNPEADKQTAIDNNFTLRYNRLDLENMTDDSIQQENLQRTIAQQEEQVASQLVNLYNQILQKRNEYQTAVASYELEQTKMESTELKMQVGTIGRLEYLQQETACVSGEIAVKNAELALFQAMETYDWALKGNLSLT